MKKRDVVVKLIEQYLDFLGNTKRNLTHKRSLDGFHLLPLKRWDGSEPLLEEWHEGCKGTAMRWEEDPCIFTDAKITDLGGPLDCSFLTRPAGEGEDGERFGLIRYKTVHPKAMRGRVNNIYPYNIEAFYGWVFPNHSYETGHAYYGSLNGLDWYITLREYLPRSIAERKQSTERIRICIGTQFTRRYDWRIFIGLPDAPRISVVTDVTGIKAFFKDRSIPEGKARRAALKNWVKEHWRQRRDRVTFDFVREHMRGAADFNWNGYSCKIVPSAFDLECARKAKNEREFIKFMGFSPRVIASNNVSIIESPRAPESIEQSVPLMSPRYKEISLSSADIWN